ncbi:MAG: PDZ domain-containing protein [Candidatus Aminicenantes bacterium]|nr:PDZ domain-containing protein [Candidatus Aminicenantes bacterium]
MRTQRLRVLALGTLSLVLLFLLLARSFIPGQSAERPRRGLSPMESIIKLIRDDYIERVDAGRTMEGAFRGLVQALDPLSSYLSPNELAKHRETADKRLYDPGVVLFKEAGGMPRVLDLEEGRPAARSGLKPGDLISAVDDQPAFGLSLTELRLLLLSREKKPVKFRVVRQTATEEIEVERSLPPAADCAYVPEKNTAGVLTVRRMSPALAGQAAAALPSEVKTSLLPLVLDLRTCAQGDPESAGRFINLFLKADEAGVFLTQDGTREPLSCPEDPVWDKTPLVVWTGPATLGPAEIAAGVLRSFKRAKVIGHRTPGLPARQTLTVLEDGSALLLTTAVFSPASGEKLWEEGVVPDIDLGEQPAARNVYLKKTLDTAGGR